MPLETRSMARKLPILPVEQTSASPGSTPTAAAASAAIAAASRRPRGPVTALAHPAFTTMTCAVPAATRSRQRCTGAAAARCEVNTPAAAAGGPETMRARSSPPERLSPAATPAARNPPAAQTAPGISVKPLMESSRRQTGGVERRGLVEPEHQVGILHRLPGGTLAEVVDGADRDRLPGPGVGTDRHLGDVGAGHSPGARQLAGVQHPDERLLLVAVVEDLEELLGAGDARQRCAAGCQQPPGHRRQM